MNGPSKYKMDSAGDCISEQMMFDYIDNKLSQKQRHLVEKHLLDCELCSDAMEGLELVKNRRSIAEINTIISSRIVGQEQNRKTISFNYKTIVAIAAAFVILVGAIFLFKGLTNHENYVAEKPLISPTSQENRTKDVDTARRSNDRQTDLPLSKTPSLAKQENQNKSADDKSASTSDVTQSAPIVAAEGDENVLNEAGSVPEYSKKGQEFVSDSVKSTDKYTTMLKAAPTAQKNKEEKMDVRSFAESENFQRAPNASDNSMPPANKEALFPGGTDSLVKFIRLNFRSTTSITSDIKDAPDRKIILEFTIDKNGTVKKTKIIRGIDLETDKEIVRIILLSPKWYPAENNGKPVSSKYNLTLLPKDFEQ